MTTIQRAIRDISLIALAVAAMAAGLTWAVAIARQTPSDELACIPLVVAGTAAAVVAWRVAHRSVRRKRA